jgi:hypothetical protein
MYAIPLHTIWSKLNSDVIQAKHRKDLTCLHRYSMFLLHIIYVTKNIPHVIKIAYHTC